MIYEQIIEIFCTQVPNVMLLKMSLRHSLEYFNFSYEQLSSCEMVKVCNLCISAESILSNVGMVKRNFARDVDYTHGELASILFCPSYTDLMRPLIKPT